MEYLLKNQYGYQQPAHHQHNYGHKHPSERVEFIEDKVYAVDECGNRVTRVEKVECYDERPRFGHSHSHGHGNSHGYGHNNHHEHGVVYKHKESFEEVNNRYDPCAYGRPAGRIERFEETACVENVDMAAGDYINRHHRLQTNY